MIRKTTTENGIVRGTPAADPRITAFRGIPFAAPPVGENRWRAPQPAKDWEGVLDCLEFAPISMQPIPGLDRENIYSREWNVDPDIPMSEDCLYLNVWTPAASAADKLPVFVWFFGGGLQVGNPAEMEFDGERIARRGVVVVTVNYRVNAFGFLTHPEIAAEAPEAPANFGNLDQQSGLRWTKRNIANFGGDPDNITIGGQSAGGMSVLTQLNCEENAGDIQRAIILSGIMMKTYQSFMRQMPLADAAAEGEKFFAFLGVKTLAEARALKAEYIRDKAIEYRGFWGTVVDGVYQKDSYMNNIFRGAFLDVPIMIGHTDAEFPAAPQAESEAAFRALAETAFGADAPEFLSMVKLDEGLDGAIQNATVKGIEWTIRTALRRMDERGWRGPHYYYEFGPSIPGWDNPGAFHSVDLWFWFETLAKCWRPFAGAHYDLARQMCNYWANFIRTGNPNGSDADGTPMETWEPYAHEKPNCMELFTMPKLKLHPASPIMEFLVRARRDCRD